MKLPRLIHVIWEKPENGDPFLMASNGELAELMEDDGPMEIGTYKLVKTFRATKCVEVTNVRLKE